MARSKLGTLLRFLEHRERTAQRVLKQRHQAVDGARVKADQLTALQAEYQHRLGEAGETGMRATDLRLWRRFTESLEDVVAVQSAQVAALKRELEQAQAACMAARARRLGGELLQDSRQRREMIVARRKERIETADAASRRGRE